MATLSWDWNVSSRSKHRDLGFQNHWRHRCLLLFCVYVVLCSYLAIGWLHVKGTLPTIYKTKISEITASEWAQAELPNPSRRKKNYMRDVGRIFKDNLTLDHKFQGTHSFLMPCSIIFYTLRYKNNFLWEIIYKSRISFTDTVCATRSHICFCSQTRKPLTTSEMTQNLGIEEHIHLSRKYLNSAPRQHNFHLC